MKNAIEQIKKRRSIRTYDDTPIEKEKIEELKDFLLQNVKGPFGNTVRFEVVDASEAEKDELKKLGTYGNIRGARIFLAGTVRKGTRSMEDFGYCMENLILKATELGIGTCWLGGSLNRSTFADKLKTNADEVIPAITPLGYAADKRWIMDRVIRTMSKGSARKHFGVIFFNADWNTPLEQVVCGQYSEVLEAIRLAPSASNKQPWRILKEKDKNIFHFYLKENKIYNNALKDIKIQNLDMGIAMCHLEMSVAELGLKGSWQPMKQTIGSKDLEYITSWIGD